MDLRRLVINQIEALIAEGTLPDLDLRRVVVEPQAEGTHGHFATNAALVLAKPAGMPPRELAKHLFGKIITLPNVIQVEIAGPGFVNFTFDAAFWAERLGEILTAGKAYGALSVGRGQSINIEYVSANPTGPMHIGHARGAVIGDVLANLLAKAGYRVTREYYINDAGAQVDILARSLYIRYTEICHKDFGFTKVIEKPEDFYPGDYLIDLAKQIVEKDETAWVHVAEKEWLPVFRGLAIQKMMALIKADLHLLGIKHDVFTSERQVVESGGTGKVVRILEEKNLLHYGVLEAPKGKVVEDWEPRSQLLFKASQFGDDVDRALKKSDDTWTYFANDIAYHLNKHERGFDTMIDIWGADHGGAVKRLRAAMNALTDNRADLDVKLYSLVKLMENGIPVVMSKRTGNMVTLREVVEEVGKDAVRLTMLTRSMGEVLDFDYAKVVESSKDNPVFYMQYALARAKSVMRQAKSTARIESVLSDVAEIDLIRALVNWPNQVEIAARLREPHRIAFYAQNVAAHFHTLWAKGDTIDKSLRFHTSPTRLALVQAVITVIGSVLDVMGVELVEKM